MTDYELLKQTKKLSTPKYWIKVETKDLEFLNYMDKKLDELIREFYNE